jgi:hypothetical protein
MTTESTRSLRDLLLLISASARQAAGIVNEQASQADEAAQPEYFTAPPRIERTLERLVPLLETLNERIAALSAAQASLLAAAVASAAAQGATPAQLRALSDLHTALGGETAQLSAALAGRPLAATPSP